MFKVMQSKKGRTFVGCCTFAILLAGELVSVRAATFTLQEGVSPSVDYVHQDVLIRNDNGLANTAHGAGAGLLVGSHPGSGVNASPGHLRSLIEFDLAPIATGIGASAITNVSLTLWLQAGTPTSRVDGSPMVNIHHYGFPVLSTTATWNDPDGDGNVATGDLTPGGTMGDLLGTFGELTSASPLEQKISGGEGSALLAAIQNALAGEGKKLRLIVVEDQANTATRDIAFFRSSALVGANIPMRPRLIIETPTLIPGDYDSDGKVDGADFAKWQDGFPMQSGAGLADGDGDGDGDVDGADFVLWQTNIGATASVTAVPEPTAASLALVASGVVFWVRRRRASFKPQS